MDPIEAMRLKLAKQLALKRARDAGTTTSNDDPDELSRYDELELLEESKHEDVSELLEQSRYDDVAELLDNDDDDEIISASDLDEIVDLDDDDVELDDDDDDLAAALDEDAELDAALDAELDADLGSGLDSDTGTVDAFEDHAFEDIEAAVARDMMEKDVWGETVVDAVVPGGAQDLDATNAPSGALRECPMCAETIKARARICRYCRYDLIAEKLPALAERVEHNLELAWKQGGWDMVAVHELRKLTAPLTAAAGDGATPRRALELICNLSLQLSEPAEARKPGVIEALLTALEEVLAQTSVDPAPLATLATAIRNA